MLYGCRRFTSAMLSGLCKPRTKIAPAEAAEQLCGDFEFYALRMAAGDKFLSDDLRSIMCLAVLQCSAPATPSWFLTRALWRVRSELRKQARRDALVRMESLDTAE